MATARVRVLAGCAMLAVMCGSNVLAQEAGNCPSCASDAALIARFQLREAVEPIRQKLNWSPPKKVVVVGGQEWVQELQAVLPNAEVIGVPDAGAALAVLVN